MCNDGTYEKWNRWTGGDDGSFFHPDSWSRKRVPDDGDSFYIDNGCLELPGGRRFGTVVVNGPCTLTNEPDVPVAHIDTLLVTKNTEWTNCTIGQQGRAP